MPIMPFSIPEHIPLLLDGRKVQTTRQPRKKPLKVGDVLYCYYKPRQKKGCSNCISKACKIPIERRHVKDLCNFPPCDKFDNYFGVAEITGIIHCNNILGMNSLPFEYYLKGENWIHGFDKFNTTDLLKWAKADGFANLDEADKWFGKSTRLWKMLDWDVITFHPRWLKCQ